jgi:hypothetical protein
MHSRTCYFLRVNYAIMLTKKKLFFPHLAVSISLISKKTFIDIK